MALNDAVPSSATDVFKRNIEDTDRLLNTNDDVVNRVGTTLESFPNATGRVSDAADAAQIAIQADVDNVDASRISAQSAITSDSDSVEASRIAAELEMANDVSQVNYSEIAAQASIQSDVDSVDATRILAEQTIQDDVDAAKAAAIANYQQWNSRGNWASATTYLVGDIWQNTATSTWYLVLNDYTSGATVNDDITGPNVTVLQGAGIQSFEGLSEAIAKITANPELFSDNSSVSISSNKTKAECVIAGVDFPDGNGGDYVITTGETLVDGRVIAAGTKQLKLITQKLDLPIENVVKLREFEPTVDGQECTLSGHTLAGIGGGPFYAILNDTGGVDNNGTKFMTPDGHSWNRKTNNLCVSDFGSIEGVDSSAAANDMINAVNRLFVEKGFTLTCKNIELFNDTKVVIDGAAKLPDGLIDFDRMFHANEKSNIEISVAGELDGNKAGQSGDIGTHLIYLTNCPDAKVIINKAGGNYYPRTIPTQPSPDGFRSNSGAIYLYMCERAICKVKRLYDWGREGVWLRFCNHSISQLEQGTGSPTGDEWSGLQHSGDYNVMLSSSVDFAGASGIGFDSRYSVAGDLISTNTRFFHGVNFGHDGIPSDETVVNSVSVDTCDENGINFASNTVGMKILGANVRNAGDSSINISDGATNIRFSDVSTSNPRASNLKLFNAEVYIVNSDISDVAEVRLNLSGVTGIFTNGETVTGSSSGATAEVTRYYTSDQWTFILLDNVVGTFTTSDVITGATSAVTATVTTVTASTIINKSGSSFEYLTNTRLSADSLRTSFVSIPFGTGGVTITNGNIRTSSLVKIYPSNSAGAEALPYLSAVNDGSVVIGVVNSAAAGAGLRYDID